MSIKKAKFVRLIKDFNFDDLLHELGWNHYKGSNPVQVKIGSGADPAKYVLQGIRERNSYPVFICQTEVPLKANQRKEVSRQLSKKVTEHVIIFCDEAKTQQIWLWPQMERGKPKRHIEVPFYKSMKEPELLFQKLSGLYFSIDEEETLTAYDVKERLQAAFHQNAEKVTKKFYAEFKTEHGKFLKFIKGLEESRDREWYTSLMLNRLMFCYFIQKKGFLDGDKDYLQNRLKAYKSLKGKNQFHSFFRSFLLELFHHGLGEPESTREPQLKALIGNIPYLNGGLFDEHHIERDNPKLLVEDAAFESLFAFFDEWRWTLDERENADNRTINPDVIGYIFEKYINDRAQMGAYYTKEDITEYISKNCILPWLFDEVERHHPSPFKGKRADVWNRVQLSGDRYIYDAVKHGLPDGIDPLPEAVVTEWWKTEKAWGDLPDDVQAGLDPNQAGLVDIRKPWNRQAPATIALPTEIFREVVERRRRYLELRHKIATGQVHHINDFVTLNLDIRQMAQDLLEETGDPELIRQMWRALNKVTILDPTCGSGAFLFAALNILEPLYEACLQRMEGFVAESPGKHKEFEEVLAKVNAKNESGQPVHPSVKYYVFKTIILQNLYGVDIMNEAVEIAKLRLFLKLAAEAEDQPKRPNRGLEPLPDIDFNIRCGNTLVGIGTEAELERTMTYSTFASTKRKEINEQMEKVAMAFSRFKASQQLSDHGNFKIAKQALQSELSSLRYGLDRILGASYNHMPYKDSPKDIENYNQWRKSHHPFHWLGEYYDILKNRGGFDIIIGNPPYVEEKEAMKLYSVKDAAIAVGGNLHSMTIARSVKIINDNGFLAMIVPCAIANTERMTTVRRLLMNRGSIWSANFAIRPGKLFEGADQRVTIFISNSAKEKVVWTTPYKKWSNESREYLFTNFSFGRSDSVNQIWPKEDRNIKIFGKLQSLRNRIVNHRSSYRVYYKNTGINYFISSTLAPPKCIINGTSTSSSRETTICAPSKDLMHVYHALLVSSTYFYFYQAFSNCRDLNPIDISSFPIPDIEKDAQLAALSTQLQANMESNSWMQTRIQKQTGEVVIQTFRPGLSKPIIDLIDKYLAKYYAFTEEELDFIINYDIKYRMGDALGEED